MVPFPLAILIWLAVPVRVALVRVFPVLLPISSWPSVYVLCPVPPKATGIAVPFQVPVVMVPSVLMFDEPV